MEALAAEYAERDFTSLFVYSREAHPGEHLLHHTSLAQKLDHARTFRVAEHLRRRILVDALDGPVHRQYGALPNMTWIILRGGTIAYKAAWTEAWDVRAAMERIAQLGELRRQGGRLAPFWTERLGFRVVDQAAFMAGLVRNGPKAVTEFEAFMRHTALDRLDEDA
ncbi:MAG TPA: hypothetical protein VGN32_17735 [Ktedonobacterales bacterium]|jgi:hypothetical protein|nr:hypothetical protein [Ktedonobacterales bacterium]